MMRFVSTGTLLLAVTLGSFINVASTDQKEHLDDVKNTNHEELPKALRGIKGTDLFSRKVPIMTFEKSSQAGEVDFAEQISNIERVHQSVDAALVELKEVDTSAYPEFSDVSAASDKYREEISKVLKDLIDHLNTIKVKKEVEKKNIKDFTVVHDEPRRESMKNEEERKRKKDRKYKSNHEEKQKHFHKEFYRHAREEAHASGRGKTFDLLEAMHRGDHLHAKAFMSSLKKKVGVRMGRHGRRATENVNKLSQCQELAECASKMTLYDLVVYYISDDIDPITGEIDDTMSRNDESNIIQKQEGITRLANIILDADDSDDIDSTCDNLLQSFHRSIERNDAVQWEGAHVGQVCLAQGTTAYADLVYVVDSIHGVEDVLDDTEGGGKEQFEETLEYFIKEVVDCARDLFNTTQRHNGFPDEEFAFSTNENYTSVDELRFPVSYQEQALFVDIIGWRRKEIDIATTLDDLPSGSDFDDDDVLSALESCKDYCIENECAAFDHDRKNGICYFYTSVPSDDYYALPDNTWDLDRKYTWSYHVKGECEWSEYSERKHGHTARDIWEEETSGNDIEEVFGKDIIDKDDCYDRCKTFWWCLHADYYVKPDNVEGTQTCKLGRADIKPYDELSYDEYTTRMQCNIVGGTFYDSQTRDIHGQVQDSQTLSYEYKTYTELKEDYETCVEEIADNTVDEIFECVQMITDSITLGLKIVFGENPSPGYICGVKDAMVEDENKTLPGTCCLDAPYELDGDLWGNEFECGTTCKRNAPFFAGLTEESCLSYGGTYCPSVDCTNLQSCIATYKEEAADSNLTSFYVYLASSPDIEDPTDESQCYQAREYFGFEDTYINDLQICEDTWQLRYVSDFDFLDEFFDQGSDSTSGEEVKLDDTYSLTEPSNAMAEKNQDSNKWTKINLSMENVITTISGTAAIIGGWDCLFDWFGICSAIKNIIHHALMYTILALRNALAISRYLQNTMLSAVNHGEMYDQINSLWDHMKNMGGFLSAKLNTDEFRVTRNLLPYNYVKPIIEIDGTVGKSLSSMKLEMQVKIMEKGNSTKLLVLSTLDGKKIDPKFAVEGSNKDHDGVRAIGFSMKHLGRGLHLIKVMDEAEYLVLTCSKEDLKAGVSIESSHVVSLM